MRRTFIVGEYEKILTAAEDAELLTADEICAAIANAETAKKQEKREYEILDHSLNLSFPLEEDKNVKDV